MASINLVHETSDLSYHNSMPSLTHCFMAEEVNDLSTISPPRRALTKDLPQHLRLQPTQNADLTPPPSPQSGTLKFGPLLSRASSVLGRSRHTSPTRTDPRAASPLRESSSPTPSKESSPSLRASKFANSAVAFSELFQGTSELVNSWSFRPQESTYTVLVRPSASRSTTTKSSRASIFSKLLPSKQHQPICEEEDEIMNLNIDDELFRGFSPNDNSAEALDSLAGNAERTFMRVQIAHSATLQRLMSSTARASDLEQELAEEKVCTSHLKSQLDGIGGRLLEQEQLCGQLQAELDYERRTRIRTIRAVSPQPTLNMPGKDGHRLFSGDCGDRIYSLTQAGLDLSDEESSGESVSWSPPVTPGTGSRPSSISGDGPLSWVEENRALKARILELEETVEGCLRLVRDLGM